MFRPGKMTSQVLRSLFKKPATSSYPFVKKPMPKDFRGKLRFYQERCIGCKMCFVICPEGCISSQAKNIFQTDYTFCKGCGLCAEVCPKKDIEMVKEDSKGEEK